MFLLYFDIEQKKEYLLFGKNRLGVLFFCNLSQSRKYEYNHEKYLIVRDDRIWNPISQITISYGTSYI